MTSTSMKRCVRRVRPPVPRFTIAFFIWIAVAWALWFASASIGGHSLRIIAGLMLFVFVLPGVPLAKLLDLTDDEGLLTMFFAGVTVIDGLLIYFLLDRRRSVA